MIRIRARHYVDVPTKRQPAGLRTAKVIWGAIGVLILVSVVIALAPVLAIALLLLVLLRSTGANLTPLAEACERLAAWLRRTPMPEPAGFVMSEGQRRTVTEAADGVRLATAEDFERAFGTAPRPPRAYPH